MNCAHRFVILSNGCADRELYNRKDNRMHLTLHLTDECNLRCKYCYVHKSPRKMSLETAFAAVDMAMRTTDPTGIVFFGGEPLLERELIYKTVAYARKLSAETKHKFYYKITTNGLLLDEEFLKFTKDCGMIVGFSHDGLMQDDCRVFADGSGSAALLENKIPLLLQYQPYAVAMTTVNPETVGKFADSIQWLFDRGFRYLVSTPNYSADAKWNDASLKELEKQYKQIAGKYLEWTNAGEKFYFGAFEMKILSHLHGEKYAQDRCQLGKKQISVDPDGKLYPCVQFIDDSKFYMGDTKTGVNHKLQADIEEKGSKTPETCEKCVVKARCNHTCGCMNKQSTGSIDIISPVQCAHEQMLLKIVDDLAEKLYRKRNALFIHKHYNEFYPIISLVEDKTRSLSKRD